MTFVDLFPNKGIQLIENSRWFIVSLIEHLNKKGIYPTEHEIVALLDKQLVQNKILNDRFYLGEKSLEDVIEGMIEFGIITEHTKGKSAGYQLTDHGKRVLLSRKARKAVLEAA